MLRVAMLSMWHVHAEGYAKFVQDQPDAKLTCLWDADEARGRMWADQFGIDFVADIDALLEREDVDAVVVDAPTTEHAFVILKAIEHGKHIFTEKALAPTMDECQQIASALKEKDIKFCISHPALMSGAVQFAKTAIERGDIGRVTYMRSRTSHGGSSDGWLPDYWHDETKTAGGAMMDLGCHPNYLAAYLLGKPKRVMSMFNNICSPGTAEDNAVSVVEFENQALAVLETSFVAPWCRSPIEIMGTQGAIIIEGSKLFIHSQRSNLSGWLEVDDLPEDHPLPLRQFLNGVLYDQPITTSIKSALKLTQLLQSEYEAHAAQRTVDVPAI